MNIGELHPQLVHFVVALFFVGLAFRLVALTGRLSFTGPAATTLLVISAVASWFAVKSGTDAHGPAERVPGARDAVVEHEEWGERARNLLLVIGLVELGAFALGPNERRRRIATGLRVGSAVLGLAGAYVLYEAAEHGGDLVYGYAGGVGIRSGDPQDVENLLTAGLYHNAMQDRAAGRKADAARLIEEMVRRQPLSAEVRLLAVESRIKDANDALGALAMLTQLTPPADERMRIRAGLLRVDAYEAAGMADSASAALAQLKRDFPNSTRVAGRKSPASVAP